jgi:diguanylate cyclase (GGDEF)-like protein
MTDEMLALRSMLEKGADADVLREMIGFAAQRLMELEVQGLTGVGHGERSADRLAQRNGYRERDSDTVGRIGSDEFVVILPDIASIDAAVLVKNKIAETTAQPIRLDAENTHVCVTASIGVAVYPLDANGPEDLLKVADAAMYQVKAEARFH